MVILFVRHGNTFEKNEPSRFIGSKGNPPLTRTGREQIERVGLLLIECGFTPNVIYCGPRLRQQESAQIICEQAGGSLKPIIEPALEEVDYGPWEGLTQDEILAKWPREFEAWQVNDTWPDSIFGTSASDFKRKIENWISSLHSLKSNIVVVTSNGVLRVIYGVLGAKKICESSKVKPGNVCAAKVVNEKMEVLFWNREPTNELLNFLTK